MDKIRCPKCRGSKQVAKIGGMLGDCSSCLGTGSINAEDKPKPVQTEVAENITSIVKEVANCIPASEIVIKTEPVSPDIDRVVVDSIKVDPKRTLYKRKK